MRRLRVSAATLWISLAVAFAASPDQAAARARACCQVAAGTPVEVELVDPISTKTAKAGDAVELRLAEPLIVQGQVVLRAGALGVGEVVESAKPGLGGKAAKLVLAARYLGEGRARVPLQALQLAATGRNNAAAAQVMGLGGIAFAPLGFVGLAVQGGDVTFPAGTQATAEVAAHVHLRPLGRASRRMLADADQRAESEASTAPGAVEIPPPPPGEGQVVFFRKKSILSVGQPISIRQGGKTLGRLNNGSYFIDVVDPGRRAYSATMEPELKDKLTLEVAPGQTVFVEGVLTKGVVLGAADLTPSSRAAFDKVSAQLSPPSAYEEPAASDSAAGGETPAADAAGSAPPGR